jgi:hypothetical protein
MRRITNLGADGAGQPPIRRPATAQWMLAAFATALALVALVRLYGPAHGQLTAALRVTARWSFVWFWLASVGGALATLFGSRFQAMARRGREFGLAFASAHLVHLALVALLYYAPVTSPSQGSLIFFGIAALWTYLLAALSIGRLSTLLGQRAWRIVRRIGIEYISLAFLADFAKNPLEFGLHGLVFYLPFQVLAIAGPLLRLAADAKRRRTAVAPGAVGSQGPRVSPIVE